MKIILAFVLVQVFIKSQSVDLNGLLVTKFAEITSYNVLNDKYQEIKSNKSDPGSKSQTLSDLFTKRLQILQKTVEQVESRMEAFDPPELHEDDVIWARELNESYCELHERGSYGQPICLTNSSVHIPIDIFQGDREMLRTVAWTAVMDGVWSQNLASHPDLHWQYFGSTSGVLRVYPGALWPNRSSDKEGTPIDLYDVRRRSWFIEGLSQPKEMLILIDSSGSSQGQALALMKHITRSLLDTLDENDNINVLTFPKDVSELGSSPCFPAFMKATFRNKQKVKDYMNEITSMGIANFSRALEAAFMIFENGTSNLTTTTGGDDASSAPHCNQMIMLLTDGGNERPREVLRTYNSLQRVRIFTYLVGPISTDAPAIKWIADKSRGQFYQIPSIVAIRSQTQDYVRYLSESKINSTNPYTWSSASIDHLNDEVVVSVTVPLFNRSLGRKEINKTVLGVLGVDIPVQQFADHVHTNMGQYGYFFVINSQGFVLYHPRLHNVGEEFLSVDILDLETDDKMEEIRRKMIDGEKGVVISEDFDDMLDEHHTNIKKRTYHFEPISRTEFSFCIVLYDEAMEGTKETKITGSVNAETFPDVNSTGTDIIFNDKDYCSGLEKERKNRNESDFEIFLELIERHQCDVDKLKSLIFDIRQTESTGASWVANSEHLADDFSEITMLFVETPNMFRIYGENSSEMDFVQTEYDKFRERISKTSKWFVTSLDNEEASDNDTTNVLLIARRITNGDLTMAVIGALVQERWLQDRAFGEDLVEVDNATTTIRYLLDDGGFVVTTNVVSPNNFTGTFFGDDEVERDVMKSMILNGIYRGHRSTGYLASCEGLDVTDFSPRLQSLIPFLKLLSPTWWLSLFMSQLVWFCSVFQVLFSMLEAVVLGDVFMFEPEVIRGTEYCAKDFYKYTFAPRAAERHEGVAVDCRNCTKKYSTEMLPDLRLLLVTVVSEDACSCHDDEEDEPLLYKPQLNGNNTRLMSLLYRKDVPCSPYSSEREETYSSGVHLSPSWKLSCLLLVLVATAWKTLSRGSLGF